MVWALAQRYFDGSVTNTPISLVLRRLDFNQCEVRYDTLRGFFYKLQSTPSLDQPFVDDPAGFVRAFDTSITQTNAFSNPGRFFRAVRSATP